MSKTKIVIYEGMGRGVQAEKDLEQGEIVCVCELLVLSPEDTVNVNKTDLQYYTFKYNDTQDCLVLGDGEIFNHDDNPNVSYTLLSQWYNGQSRKVMVFRALRDVPKGQQLFIDYNADIKVSTNDYKNAKSLVG